MGDVVQLKKELDHATWDQLICALQALVDAGVPHDIQVLLLYGNPDRGVRPGALEKAIAAVRKQKQ